MGREARRIKARKCRTCKETMEITARGIKRHFKDCKKKEAPKDE